jgi:hypothetical protein
MYDPDKDPIVKRLRQLYQELLETKRKERCSCCFCNAPKAKDITVAASFDMARQDLIDIAYQDGRPGF